jgi:hypothetical protein
MYRGINTQGGQCEFAAPTVGSCPFHESGHSRLRFTPHAAPGTKVSNAQEADPAKLQTLVAHRGMTGPDQSLVWSANAALKYASEGQG